MIERLLEPDAIDPDYACPFCKQQVESWGYSWYCSECDEEYSHAMPCEGEADE